MEKIIKKILIIVIYVGLILISTKVYADTGVTTAETTRIREKSSTDSEIVALVSVGEEVTILSSEDNWYKVEYEKNGKNYSGYIRKDMLDVTNSDDTNNTTSNDKQEETNSTEINQTSENNVSDIVKDEENDSISVGYTAKSDKILELKILPTITASVISQVESNQEYKVKEVMNKWSYIESNEISGWISNSKLSGSVKASDVKEENSNTEENEQKEENISKEEDKKQETNEPVKEEKTTEVTNKTKYISAETLNIREEASSSGKIISQLDMNTKVKVIEEVNDSWCKIEANGVKGYVSSKFLSDSKVQTTSRNEETAREESKNEQKNNESTEKTKNNNSSDEKSENNTSSSTTGSSVVQYAKQYLGCKYVMGGTSPSGFDCSGFTSYVYKHFGVSLSRASGAQASNGTGVSRSNLNLGDILIFNNSSNTAVGHVGIYIGENKFIHAANPSKGVIITSLSDSYYSKRYVGARRVL